MSHDRSSSFRKKKHYGDDDEYDHYSRDDRDYDKRNYEDECDVPTEDFYCVLCSSQMNSLLTWDMHVMGCGHKKRKATVGLENDGQLPVIDSEDDLQECKLNLPGGPSVLITSPSLEVAIIQKRLDNTSFPIVGLSFVREIWRKSAYQEPIYKCDLCEADYQLITIIQHIVGFKHRMSYIKMKEPKEYRYFSRSTYKKSILNALVSECTQKLELKHGRGHVAVEVEVNEDSQGASAAVTPEPEPRGRCETDDHADTQTADIPSERDMFGYFHDQPAKERREILLQMDLPPTDVIDQDLFVKLCQDYVEYKLASLPPENVVSMMDSCVCEGDFTAVDALVPECSNKDLLKKFLQKEKEKNS